MDTKAWRWGMNLLTESDVLEVCWQVISDGLVLYLGDAYEPSRKDKVRPRMVYIQRPLSKIGAAAKIGDCFGCGENLEGANRGDGRQRYGLVVQEDFDIDCIEVKWMEYYDAPQGASPK